MPRGKSQRSWKLIKASQEFLAENQPATVRAVCYRLFTMGLIESMSKACTNRVSTQLTWAREHDYIPWAWIVDETREAERVAGWEDPEAFMETAKRVYRRDRWALQPRRVEVWSEKGTVRGTLAPVLREYGVTFRVMHGYASATTVYQVAAESRYDSGPLTVFYVGDWDPSGLHMSEVDLPARLEEYRAQVELNRMALTEDDVTDLDLPSFAADTKRSDPRWRWYSSNYGRRCWELDALSPVVLRERVKDAIRRQIDWDAWERCGRAEAAEQESLVTVLGGWRDCISGQATE